MSTGSELSGIITPEPEGLTFGEALEVLKKGGKIRRTIWPNGYVFCVSLKMGDRVCDPSLVLSTEGRTIIGWLPQFADLVASDWEEKILLDVH